MAKTNPASKAAPTKSGAKAPAKSAASSATKSALRAPARAAKNAVKTAVKAKPARARRNVPEVLGIGIIGAGGIARGVHIPGYQK